MTTGAVILAFNNEEIDYVAMAKWSAARIHRHLGLPVCLITDGHVDDPVFEHVIQIDRSYTQAKRHFEDLAGSVTWYNHDRTEVFDLSPWDRTMVIDADYIIASDRLSVPLESNLELVNFTGAFDVTQPRERLDNLNHFGAIRMPMSWATLIIFNKTSRVKQIFHMMSMVKMHWRHYCDIYGIGRSAYRNDFALTIARLVTNGHLISDGGMLYDMACVLPAYRLEQIDQDSFRVCWTDSMARRRWITLADMDFHAMCKGSLGGIVANHT